MYEQSSTLVGPGNTLQVLWRYLSAERLLDLLQSGELFFSHLPTLDDAKEGALTNRSREHLASWFQHQNRASRLQAYAEVDEYQKSQRFFYVNCWHMNDHESYLMWKAYADRGFAIQTTFERLTGALDATRSVVTGGVVDYVDFERDLTLVGNVFNHVATKDMPYRDEREFRLVFWDVDPRNQGFRKAPNGVRIPVDVQMLVRTIVRSPYPESLNPELERLIEHHKLSYNSSSVTSRLATAPANRHTNEV
ncbi:MAG: hypothetical protein WCV99_16395 [Sterolibacterium sp.]|jgi:hypothetical protein